MHLRIAQSLRPSLTSSVFLNWPNGEVAKAQTLQEETIAEKETIDLGEGRTLILIPDNTLPYVAVDLDFQGGDTLITKEQEGLSVLAARVLTKGTGSLDAPAIEKYLADRAAAISASASRRSFSLSARYPARFGKDVLSLFTGTVQNPSLNPEEVDREKN